MKIAALVYGLDGRGGIAKHVLYLCRALIELGHTVDVWAVEYDAETCYPEIARSMNIQSLRRPGPIPFLTDSNTFGGRMNAYLRGLYQYRRDQQQLAELIPGGYDVINPHGNAIHWAAAAYREQHGTPSVWLCNDFWPMTYQQSEPDGGLTSKVKQQLKRSLVAPFDRLDHNSVRAMDGIVVLSERVQAQMKQHYGVDSVVVRPGVERPIGNLSREALRARLGIGDSTFMLLTLCMLMPRRRIEDAVQAARLLVDRGYDIHYVIAGATTHTLSYTEFIYEQIQTLGLQSHVTVTGEVPEAELGSYYDACDAFVWPADETQSWGLASMEAMLAERPLLVSSGNGLSEALTDGVHALFFALRSPEAIAAQVERLINDPPLRQSIAREGKQLVEAHYSWQGNARAMLNTFEAAIADHQSVSSKREPAYKLE